MIGQPRCESNATNCQPAQGITPALTPAPGSLANVESTFWKLGSSSGLPPLSQKNPSGRHREPVTRCALTPSVRRSCDEAGGRGR